MDRTTIIDPNPNDGSEERIGSYRPVCQIGEGGMGVVYRAQQLGPLRRDVALKIIKPGMDSKEIIARFETERQALAVMDHPNIARVFDAGTTLKGRPYFVMELVDGVPITRFCESRKLSIRDRVDLFIMVCQAIQHAHQKGVIHRDIKPGNILVAEHEGKATPKVIDFGLAKALGQQVSDASMMTNFGVVVGTPEYMSPEQAAVSKHDIDTRSDVYSLGVVLYELLTGTTPLRRETLAETGYIELLRQIREADTERPGVRLRRASSSKRPAEPGSETGPRQKLLDEELDWITMKALDKDRTHRYETVAALARDLQRYLEGEPVEAGPPSAVYRLRKVVWKYRAWLTTAAAFALLLIAGLIVSTLLAYVARKENARAEENLRLAQNAVDEMLSSAGRQSARVASDIPQLEEFRKELLDKAKTFYTTFAAQEPNNEKVRRETARAHFRLGDIFRILHQSDDAEREYKEAIVKFEGLTKDYPATAEYSQALANSYNWLGETLRPRPGTSTAADEAYAKAIQLQESLVRQRPDNPDYQRELARSYYNRGILRFSASNFPGSESDFRAAIERLQSLSEKEQSPAASQELARALNNLGTLLRQNERLPEARDLYERAIRLQQALVRKNPQNREYKQELATYNNNLALLLVDEKKFADAEEKNLEALNLIEGLAQPALSLGIESVQAHSLRCEILAANKFQEALAECQKSLDALNQLATGSEKRVEFQKLFRDLGYNYLDLARNSRAAGSASISQAALENLSRVLPNTSETDRQSLSEAARELSVNRVKP
jgi:serine/threonine protein kinase/type II secretory pathway pseudopilin PulG